LGDFMADAAHARLFREIAASAPTLAKLAEIFFTGVLPMDIEALSADDGCAILRAINDVRSLRVPGTPAVMVMSSPTHARRTAIILVTDDMPFLLDSATAELSTRGLSVHRLFHPILAVDRNPQGQLIETFGLARDDMHQKLHESVIYLEIDRVPARDRAALAEKLESIYQDVRVCVADWQDMRAKVSTAAAELEAQPPKIASDDLTETLEFLTWMAQDHFTLLGYRYYSYEKGMNAPVTLAGLGLLRDENYPVWRGAQGFSAVPIELQDFLTTTQPILITKANTQSPVHRRIHLDYIGVKTFDGSGRTTGEHRFIGLFTSTAYAQSARSVPLLRQKVEQVIAACGFDPRSHAGKALVHELDMFPRDELIQIDATTLTEIALGLVSLQERPRPKLFVRRDQFERFVSVLVYVPRDAYRADLRESVSVLLCTAFNAQVSRYSVQLMDDAPARIHFILRTTPGQVPTPATQDLDILLEKAVRGWNDSLEEILEQKIGGVGAARLSLMFGKAFSQGYRAQFDAYHGANDVMRLSKLKSETDRDADFYRFEGDAPHQVRLKIYALGKIIALSDAVPVLENLGLRVIEEAPYDLEQGKLGWVHDFVLEHFEAQPIDLTHCQERLEATLTGVLTGTLEDDGFNALVLTTGLSADRVAVLRALFRYMRQTGAAYGLDTVCAALRRYPKITLNLSALMTARFDPAHVNASKADALIAEITAELNLVTALDDDRILRQYLCVMRAIVRTNLYAAGGKEALAFKIQSKDVPGLPLPVPFMEIWIYSPRVEGIHLRGGKIARGGLRWSDRRDDFRTEILGLIKAQMVKNAVIVPVGAKGGFYPKQLPPVSDRDAWLKEGTHCYRIYIRALLSVTDNLVQNIIVPPQDVVRYDEDDPYLVVAADKGTATFSDTANAISLEHGHWLGDAFASGGSNGYDHKAMAITAKGAWISVERHFREIGLNVATDTTRIIGVGDMSGDVFGNGLLRSQAVLLVAAFDHRHIFIDPTPDAAKSFAERARLFALPRSSWDDYDRAVMSPGGGIFARSLKSIPLTLEMKKLLGVSNDGLSPTELISAILKCPADCLWLGGIGTYIKAAAETHAQVGDKANDILRVDAEDLNVKVIGEGANLGITQKARIAFAQKGGRINTDFIDNSAGVDCSDNEVNIKILLNPLVAEGALTEEARNSLLVEMTDDVSMLVLRDNYLQTQALSIAEADAPAQLGAHARLIRILEKHGLNRSVEQLPSEVELTERAKLNQGLTRPELAVVLAYAKMALYDAVLHSDVPDAAVLQDDLVQYFPTALQQRFTPQMAQHRLKREIIATKVANAIVNRGGLTLAFDLAEATNSTLGRVCGAFVGVRELFDFRRIWRMIDGYDYQIAADLQIALQSCAADILRDQMVSLIAREPDGLNLDATLAQLKPGTTKLMTGPLAHIEPTGTCAALAARGAPAEIIQLLAGLDAADAVAPIAHLAATQATDDVQLFEHYTEHGKTLGLDWLAIALDKYHAADSWERLAVQTLATDLMQARLYHVHHLGDKNNDTTEISPRQHRLIALIQDLKSERTTSMAMLTHAVAQARTVLAA
jgi:glutamate dehydrogenase